VSCTTKSPKGHSGGKPRNVVNQPSFDKAGCTGKTLISQVVLLAGNFVSTSGTEKAGNRWIKRFIKAQVLTQFFTKAYTGINSLKRI